MNSEICCPKCAEVVVKSLSGSEVKIRSKVTVFKDGECFAVCKGCGFELSIPVKLDQEALAKSLTAVQRPRLYLRSEFTTKKP